MPTPRTITVYPTNFRSQADVRDREQTIASPARQSAIVCRPHPRLEYCVYAVLARLKAGLQTDKKLGIMAKSGVSVNFSA